VTGRAGKRLMHGRLEEVLFSMSLFPRENALAAKETAPENSRG
jgi:hypothetical protein